jgi:1-acyl-sn-glycerol-3-phosphate acyltransferase
VVPVAILGSHQVRNWKRLHFPRVTVSYGEPFRFDVVEHPTREQQQEAADYILEQIRTLHAELQERGHGGARSAGQATSDIDKDQSPAPTDSTAR